MLHDRVAESSSEVVSRSGVTHLGFSVLHRYVGAVSVNAGCAAPLHSDRGGGDSMTTRFSDPSRCGDSCQGGDVGGT